MNMAGDHSEVLKGRRQAIKAEQRQTLPLRRSRRRTAAMQQCGCTATRPSSAG
jgi:hypothetical protein